MVGRRLGGLSPKALFKKHIDFAAACGSLQRLIPEKYPEFAFLGRSNVGKSSLINALTNRKALARTSQTPGRTQELIFFELEEYLYIVDMPGYGYAKAPKIKIRQWEKLSKDYLQGRTTLKRLFLLIDSRRGIGKNDEDVMSLLDEAAVSYCVILTKSDKVKKSEIEPLIQSTKQILQKHVAAFPEPLLTSAEKREGLDSLRAHIAELL